MVHFENDSMNLDEIFRECCYVMTHNMDGMNCLVCDLYFATIKDYLEHDISISHHIQLHKKSISEWCYNMVGHECILCRVYTHTLQEYCEHVESPGHRAHLEATRMGAIDWPKPVGAYNPSPQLQDSQLPAASTSVPASVVRKRKAPLLPSPNSVQQCRTAQPMPLFKKRPVSKNNKIKNKKNGNAHKRAKAKTGAFQKSKMAKSLGVQTHSNVPIHPIKLGGGIKVNTHPIGLTGSPEIVKVSEQSRPCTSTSTSTVATINIVREEADSTTTTPPSSISTSAAPTVSNAVRQPLTQKVKIDQLLKRVRPNIGSRNSLKKRFQQFQSNDVVPIVAEATRPSSSADSVGGNVKSICDEVSIDVDEPEGKPAVLLISTAQEEAKSIADTSSILSDGGDVKKLGADLPPPNRSDPSGREKKLYDVCLKEEETKMTLKLLHQHISSLEMQLEKCNSYRNELETTIEACGQERLDIIKSGLTAS